MYLVVDATAYDGCRYECKNSGAVHHMIGALVFEAASIGQTLIVEGRVYREDGDNVVAIVTSRDSNA